MGTQDIAAIVNVVNLYPVAVDSQQWELFDLVFTPDASTDFGGPAVFCGLANIKQIFEVIHAPFDATQHATHGHNVAIDGDAATCLSYVHARFIREVPDGANMFESAGWYDDTLLRTSSGWRISRRVCRTLWSGGNPAVLQTSPDVHVEQVFFSLCSEARGGHLGHLNTLALQSSQAHPD